MTGCSASWSTPATTSSCHPPAATTSSWSRSPCSPAARQAKRRLYQALVRNLGELGVAPADVFVVLHEPPMDNWGIRGGQMASEVDLGFEVGV